MSARFDLSALPRLSRRRSAKFVLAVLALVIAIALVTFTSRAWRAKKGLSIKQDAAAAQPTPLPPNANSHVRRARLWPRLRDALNVLGDRLEKPGKERLTLAGTLRRQNNSQAIPFRLFLELPRRMRLEEHGAQPRVSGFDGSEGWALGAALSDADQEMIETLVFDSADQFFISQTQGGATRALGQRFRLDDGATPNYTGPFYNIYELQDHIPDKKETRAQTKLFYFNSETLLLERVRYQIERNGAPMNVEVRLSGWQKVNNQRIPGSITRLENDTQTLTLTINAVTFSPRATDGAFNKPQGD
jgi:hypothetical protein